MKRRMPTCRKCVPEMARNWIVDRFRPISGRFWPFNILRFLILTITEVGKLWLYTFSSKPYASNCQDPSNNIQHYQQTQLWIAQKFDRRLRSTAAETPVKFLSMNYASMRRPSSWSLPKKKSIRHHSGLDFSRNRAYYPPVYLKADLPIPIFREVNFCAPADPVCANWS